LTMTSMNWKKWLIALTSLISIAAGILYAAEIGFSNGFIEFESRTVQNTVQYWSKISIGLGIVLLVTLLLRQKMNPQANDGLLIVVLSFLFLIQIPPFALWLLVSLLGTGASIGWIAVHGALLLLLVRILTLGRRSGTTHI
jgi:hypothetical protein